MDPHDDAADTTGGWIIDRDEFLKLDRGQKVHFYQKDISSWLNYLLKLSLFNETFGI